MIEDVICSLKPIGGKTYEIIILNDSHTIIKPQKGYVSWILTDIITKKSDFININSPTDVEGFLYVNEPLCINDTILKFHTNSTIVFGKIFRNDDRLITTSTGLLFANDCRIICYSGSNVYFLGTIIKGTGVKLIVGHNSSTKMHDCILEGIEFVNRSSKCDLNRCKLYNCDVKLMDCGCYWKDIKSVNGSLNYNSCSDYTVIKEFSTTDVKCEINGHMKLVDPDMNGSGGDAIVKGSLIVTFERNDEVVSTDEVLIQYIESPLKCVPISPNVLVVDEMFAPLFKMLKWDHIAIDGRRVKVEEIGETEDCDIYIKVDIVLSGKEEYISRVVEQNSDGVADIFYLMKSNQKIQQDVVTMNVLVNDELTNTSLIDVDMPHFALCINFNKDSLAQKEVYLNQRIRSVENIMNWAIENVIDRKL